jgi:hypothetical protein
MKAKYYLGTFTIKNKKWVSSYAREVKCIYFITYKKKDILEFMEKENIDGGGAYNVKLTPCKEEDLTGVYWTDGYSELMRVGEDNVIGKIDVRRREFLVWWELREHDGEYARVLRRENFIITDTSSRSAGYRIDQYVVRRHYCYADDYTFYTMTDREEEIAKVKASKNFVTITD